MSIKVSVLGGIFVCNSLSGQDFLELPPTIVLGDRLEGTIETGASVLGREEVEFFQLEELQDLTATVPNLFFTHSDTRGYGDNVTFRGQGNTVFFSPPSVGHYVDDVPSPDVFAYPSELLRTERVLLHRGPQGSGFGRNGTAGMIEVVTNRPTEEREVTFGAEYGSDDYYGFRVETSGPLGGDFSHSLQLYYNERDGYIFNNTLGRHTDDRQAMGVLTNLYWSPRDETEWRLRVFANRTRDGGSRLTALPSNLNPAALTGDIFSVNSDFAGEADIDQYQLSLHGRQDFDWGTVKSISSYQNWELDPSTADLDLGANPLIFGSTSFIQQELDYFTQEIRFESPDDDRPFAWRAGLFGSYKDNSGNTIRDFPADLDMDFFPETLVTETINFDIEETNFAAYGRATYDVTDRVTLEAGGRVEYVETTLDRTGGSNLAGTSSTSLSQDAVHITPSGGIRYSVTDEITLFATSGLGIKPGGYSAFGSTASNATFGEEQSWANEIGIDVRSPDQTWNFGLRGFYNLIDDYQLNRSVPNSTDFIVVNADEVTSMGIESEFRWRPVTCLLLHASAGFQETEFDSYLDSFTSTSFDGNQVPFVPEFTASGGVQYNHPSGFFIGSTVRVVGETFYDAANDPDFRQGSYTVWDARAGFEAENYRITLFGRNLLDEEYYNFINDQIRAGSPGAPQRFGVEVEYTF